MPRGHLERRLIACPRTVIRDRSADAASSRSLMGVSRALRDPWALVYLFIYRRFAAEEATRRRSGLIWVVDPHRVTGTRHDLDFGAWNIPHELSGDLRVAHGIVLAPEEVRGRMDRASLIQKSEVCTLTTKRAGSPSGKETTQ